MNDVVQHVLEGAARRDWAALRAQLHPYVQWTSATGGTIRGRTNVLAMLIATPPPAPPSRYELRDGQIYRWTELR